MKISGLAIAMCLLGCSPAVEELQNESAVLVEIGRPHKELIGLLEKGGVEHGSSDSLAKVFQYYADMTGVDARLLVAIAYRESQFYGGAYNSKGNAIGIMQVVPNEAAWSSYRDVCGGRMSQRGLRVEEVNICYGSHIFKHYFARHGEDVRKALNSYYSGQPKETIYADWVLRGLRYLEEDDDTLG